MTVAGSSIIATAPALADDAIFETANAAFYYPLELGALLGATVGIYLTLNKVSNEGFAVFSISEHAFGPS